MADLTARDRSAPAARRVELAELLDQRRPANESVLWVFCDQRDLWCVRQEGGRTETFAAREMAIAFARMAGEVAGPHRLFLEGSDGRFTQEFVDPDCACATSHAQCGCP